MNARAVGIAVVAILKHRNVRSARERDASWLRGLLQAIVPTAASAGDPAPTSFGRDRSQQILLDADLDGDRYLVIRIPLARPRISLSPREWEIARMVAQGHPNKRVALLMSLSPWTVGAYLRRIFAKLGVASRTAMVARVLEADHQALGARSEFVREGDYVAASADRPAGGVRLVPVSTDDGSAYRDWPGQRGGTRPIGKCSPTRRERLQ